MRTVVACALSVAVLFGRAAIADQPVDCSAVIVAAAMARAQTMEDAAKLRSAAGSGYLAAVVFASRDFALHRKDPSAARRLLALMPQEDIHDSDPDDATDRHEDRSLVLETAGDGQCTAETDRDMMALAALADQLPAQFADAVILIPDMMPAYVRYDYSTVGNPHNDANIQAQKVCRRRHAEFVKAVATLVQDKRDYFRHHAIDTRHCRALWLPESDE